MSLEPLPHYFKRRYTPAELIADALVHGFAIVAGLVGFAMLFFRLGERGDAADAVALGVYALAFFLLFGCSCAYNLSPPCRAKWLLRRLDRAAIFLMISGTYTALLSLTNGDDQIGRRRPGSGWPPSAAPGSRC